MKYISRHGGHTDIQEVHTDIQEEITVRFVLRYSSMKYIGEFRRPDVRATFVNVSLCRHGM
jgi:hypothetical protein